MVGTRPWSCRVSCCCRDHEPRRCACPLDSALVTVAALGKPRFEVLLDATIEHALPLATRLVPSRCALPWPGTQLKRLLFGDDPDQRAEA
jgi:hypothetical protein